MIRFVVNDTVNRPIIRFHFIYTDFISVIDKYFYKKLFVIFVFFKRVLKGVQRKYKGTTKEK